jgi:hypothetical protein
MQLENAHREELVCELRNEIRNLARANELFDSYIERKKTEVHYSAPHEIKIFLIQQRIKTIEKAICNNNINF